MEALNDSNAHKIERLLKPVVRRRSRELTGGVRGAAVPWQAMEVAHGRGLKKKI
jgi:hypothetical protein